MTTYVLSSPSESSLQREVRLFRELFSRLTDAFLNRIFDLRPERAARRMGYFVVLFLLSGFVISLRSYPLSKWGGHVQDIFLYLFYQPYAETYAGDPFTNFLVFIFQAFTDPRTLQYLPVFLAPFFIALQSAAIYLADIFELEEVSVARKFISEVALSGSDETIRISAGEISDESRKSANYLIGGPGKVIVDLDSVALFEKPDGTPHVIGPTGKEPGGKATIEGFERFRQAIDLRDHFIDLRDQDGKSPSVKSRSLDGIPVIATDVRLMFSIHRDREKPNAEHPYPFSKRAVENIIYKAASRVTPDLPNVSTYEFSWINNMIGLVRGELGGFMNQHKLTEYLASIGIPEVEKAKQREKAILEQARKLIPPTEALPDPQTISPAPEFTPRHQISNLFSEFARKFTDNARERGVQLKWIGVGTWKTPIEIVSEKHLKAWKLSRENLVNGSDDSMKELEEETTLRKMAALIRGVPIAAYRKSTGSARQRESSKWSEAPRTGKLGQDVFVQEDARILEKLGVFLQSRETSKKPPHQDAMKLLLLEYRKLLIEAAEFIQVKNEPLPGNIRAAIEHIESVMGIKHWVGKT